jgi:hypothetical protein
VPQLGYAAWLHVLELLSARSPSLRHVLATASMRPTVHDYGFSVVSPQTDEAHLVEYVDAHSDKGSLGADHVTV